MSKNQGIVVVHGYAQRDNEYLGYAIRFSAEYMRYWEADMPCHTERLTEHIVCIKSGAVQAIVRFLLTHQRAYGAPLNDVFGALGINGADCRKRARADLQQYAQHLHERFSITITGIPRKCMIHYQRRVEAWFGERKGGLPSEIMAVYPVRNLWERRSIP